jgi:hypothetical protein
LPPLLLPPAPAAAPAAAAAPALSPGWAVLMLADLLRGQAQMQCGGWQAR